MFIIEREKPIRRKPIVTGGGIALFVLAPILFMMGALAQDSVGEPVRQFSEQHLHTVYSPDAFAFRTRNTPDDANRYYFLYGI